MCLLWLISVGLLILVLLFAFIFGTSPLLLLIAVVLFFAQLIVGLIASK